MIPDWQLPAGVDRGLWAYLQAADMVSAYDEQMRASPLAAADLAFCEHAFSKPGRLIDLGCGTGRLCGHFAQRGYECQGVDLSDEMLAKARENLSNLPTVGDAPAPAFLKANLVDLAGISSASFDYAACLFSTLGMVRGGENQAKVVNSAFRVLKPGGRMVLHVHNKYFVGLGWQRVAKEVLRSFGAAGGDIAMTQAHGGASLTLHHFSRGEAVRLLERSGFKVREVLALGADGKPARVLWRVYGWLLLADRREH